MVQVKKKDGSMEDFDRSKVVGAVVKAGGTTEEAEKVASQVDTWLLTAAVDNTIDSFMIREEILTALRSVNAGVVASFEAYKK